MTIKKKSYFLLLEITIALILISMTIIPFSSFPYKVFKKEIIYLEEMTIEPYFTNTYAQILHNKKSSMIFEEKEVPFGKNSTLLIQRKGNIEEKYDQKSGNTLITINVTIQSKHTSQSRQKLFFIKNRREKNAI